MKDKPAAAEDEAAPIPLVIDLDGTLVRTDTLHEAVLRMAIDQPLALLSLPGWLRQGRAGFKARIAARQIVDPASLPFNDAVLEEARAAREAGRPVWLVSAADQRQAEAVAAATGLFDAVHGSTPERNLKGPEKARFLTDALGPRGFDYIGDSTADLPVWKASRDAITVAAAPALQQAAARANPNTRHIAPPADRRRAMLKAMRPHQWSKNVLLFLPMLAAHDAAAFGVVLMGFVAFCLTASAVYVINDLLDLPSDRAHPRKCRRPFAAGTLGADTGVVMALALLAVALALGLATGSPAFLGVLAVYLVSTFAYSLWIKRKLIVDVVMLAGLYTIRIIAGGAAAAIVLSPWMLGFSMFLFLALAAVKRQAELMDQMKTGRESAGRAYLVDDLPILRGVALSAGNAAVLVLALYISSDAVQTLYASPVLIWLICPLMLYWMIRMVLMTHRGHMEDDPIVFAASDRISLIVVACMAAVLVAASV